MKINFLRAFAFSDSLAGRVVVLLTLGITLAAIAALIVSDHFRTQDFEQVMLDRVITSVADINERLGRDPAQTVQMLVDERILGIALLAPGNARQSKEDTQLDRLLAAHLGPDASPHASQANPALCFRHEVNGYSERAAAIPASSLPTCWLVEFRDPRGVQRRVAVIQSNKTGVRNSTLDPLFLILTIAATASLSFLAARFMTKPLRQLADAARTFSISADPEPVPEEGPREVRAALATFNLMQHRVREGFRERTQVLAAVAHDLQTPLTRLRLRLEHVADMPLRERLIADLAAMQKLVRDGLDLARSTENREEWSVVDVDSLLSSTEEDAREAGANVTFSQGCGEHARVKPNALIRCLNNLLDNAITYGERVDLSCQRQGQFVGIEVRDHGPGIPESEQAKMFEPFVRGDVGRMRVTTGTGIGLTVARAQAATFGARVCLGNHRDGGLIATILIPVSE